MFFEDLLESVRSGYLYFQTDSRQGGVIGAHLLCQSQEGLWKVFFKCDTHCCRLFTLTCAFIYRVVPHHELSNVLWTVNFPNAVLRPSCTLTCKRTHVRTQTQHSRDATAALLGRLPSTLLSIKAPECHICLQRVSDESICHNNPCCPFEALVKAVKLLSPISQ